MCLCHGRYSRLRSLYEKSWIMVCISKALEYLCCFRLGGAWSCAFWCLLDMNGKKCQKIFAALPILLDLLLVDLWECLTNNFSGALPPYNFWIRELLIYLPFLILGLLQCFTYLFYINPLCQCSVVLLDLHFETFFLFPHCVSIHFD